LPVGTIVGTFSTTDPDAGEIFTYSFVAGDGDDNNDSFQITGNSLKTNTTINFETKTSYSIRVQTNDGNGGTFAKAFTITVTNVNEPPTNITLSFSSVTENAPVNTTVGTFSTTDPDAGSSFSYSLVEGSGDTDNGLFLIDGNILKTDASFNFETKNSHSIRVQTSDGGFTNTEIFIITIIDVNEAPVGLSDPYEVNLGESLNVTAPGVLGNDSDPDGDAITAVKMTDPTNGTLTFLTNGSFTYTPTGSFTGEDSFTYQVKDPAGLTSPSIQVLINVKDAASPSLIWIEPVNDGGQIDVNGEVILLKVEAIDDVSVDYVRFYRWDPNFPPSGAFVDIDIDEEPPFEVLINTSELNYEFNEIRARAYDDSGNVSFYKWIWLYRVLPTEFLFFPLVAGE
jgi:hypothetical protein